ncbi:MAG: polysaccharide pyruvyl transferase CsaB [Symbiobacteriaceae bacterium]|nr:polysaccharide pyruvyl transferase CsaB [Symbiobacteriaceae bacterium]
MARKEKTKRIVVSGYYGFSNVGDEAILLSLHQSLKKCIPGVELVVLSARPQQTAREHGVIAVQRLAYLRVWQELRRADLLISGGGSLFQDVTSWRSLYFYLLVLVMGQLASCPVMIFAQGVGPVRGKFNRWLTAVILRRTTLITVRDAESMQELKRLGVNRVPQVLVADPVMALPPGDKRRGVELLRELGFTPSDHQPLIGVSIRPWPGSDHLLQELELALKHLMTSRGAGIILIPMHYPGDDAITAELRSRLGDSPQVRIYSPVNGVADMISLMGSLNLVMGVRLHALVFASIATTPAIAISYDPKVDHFATRMQLALVGSIQQVKSEAICLAAEDLLANEQQVRRRFAALGDELKREAERSAELVAKLLI